VLDELARVPVRRGDDVRRAGPPRASIRARRVPVGTIMNRNPDPDRAFRAIASSARAGASPGYGGGLERKEALLRLEGAIL
jgi:O6-methylguanine-DNA--protein-cysteine methyltransferase